MCRNLEVVLDVRPEASCTRSTITGVNGDWGTEKSVNRILIQVSFCVFASEYNIVTIVLDSSLALEQDVHFAFFFKKWADT